MAGLSIPSGGGGGGATSPLVASSSLVSSFPAAADNLDNLAYLTTTDGTNLPGTYISNGTNWVRIEENKINYVSTKTADYTVSHELNAVSDCRSLIIVDSTSDITITVPADASDNFPVKSEILLFRKGTGGLIVAGAVGVTVLSEGALLTASDRYNMLSLVKIAADEWILLGKLA